MKRNIMLKDAFMSPDLKGGEKHISGSVLKGEKVDR